MALYTYTCNECGYEFDALNKIADRMFARCPECGGTSLMGIAVPADPRFDVAVPIKPRKGGYL